MSKYDVRKAEETYRDYLRGRAPSTREGLKELGRLHREMSPETRSEVEKRKFDQAVREGAIKK